MQLGLAGRTCAVTGASRGIGLAVASILWGEGARVMLVGREESSLRAAVASVGEPSADGGTGERPGEAAHLALDVTGPDAGERLVRACEERFGPLDVLVNNAGTSFARPLEELTDEDWQGQWDLHVMASHRLMRAALPGMAERGFGRVVNVCSSSGKRPSLTNAAYSVTKAAELSLSRTWADAYAGCGVRVNAVAPGPVDTPLWHAEGGLADQAAAAQGVSREDALAAAREKVPIGRFGREDEIAAVIVFLCSAAAANVSGAAWSVDGGSVPVII